MNFSPHSVRHFISSSRHRDQGAAAKALTTMIRGRFRESVRGVILYGSVLHGLSDEKDTLHDLLVVVSNYKSAYESTMYCFANWLLPPNVFYGEAQDQGATYRCKYTIISQDDFNKYTSSSCRQVYFWGRYSQPTAIAYASSEETRNQLEDILAQASMTFAQSTIALRGAEFSITEFWVGGISACYGSELRPEDKDRAGRILAQNPNYFRTLALLVLPSIGARCLDPTAEDAVFENPIGGWRKLWRRLGWLRRRFEGKCLNVARLIKAVFTFEGGVDYALWKIRRHTQLTIEISDRVRKHPLVFGWPTFWRLWRQGLFASPRDSKSLQSHTKKEQQPTRSTDHQ